MSKKGIDKKLLALFILAGAFLGYSKVKEWKKHKEVMPVFDQKEEERANEKEIHRNEESSLVEEEIYVHVSGAVKDPGLYSFSSSCRVQDAIDAAGGFQEEADPNSLNLAMKCQDEMKIHVPREDEEVDPMTSQANKSSYNKDSRVNINEASLEELMSLPGIGKARAEEILARRQEALFTSVEELKEISGIGEKTFQKLEEFVRLH